jgi:hypothetical protein
MVPPILHRLFIPEATMDIISFTVEASPCTSNLQSLVVVVMDE